MHRVASANNSHVNMSAKVFSGPGGSPSLDGLQKLADELRQNYRIDVVVEQVDRSDVSAAIRFTNGSASEAFRSTSWSTTWATNYEARSRDGPLDTALAMVRLDIASLIAVARFLREM